MFDEARVYDRIQRDFPLDERPYQSLARELGGNEQALLGLLARDLGAGRISRIGAVFAPNVIGASTLAALAVGPEALPAVARQVSAHPSVSHNYGRAGHRYNLWFVAGARDRAALDRALEEIAFLTGHAPLDLPLEREFHIDLGFPLSSAPRARRAPRPFQAQPARAALDEGDWRLVAALEAGLPLAPRPYHALAQRSALPREHVVARLAQWQESGVVRRLGAVLQHRRLGFAHNLMCVWDWPEAEVDALGARLAQLAPVSLCYRRARRLPDWPYNLFVMIHARDADEREAALRLIARQCEAPHLVLPAHTCYKQRGTRYAPLAATAAA